MSITSAPGPQGTNGARFLMLAFGGYAIVAVAATASGLYRVVHPSLFALNVVAATAGLIVAYLAVPSVRALALQLGPYGLAAFHIWRIPAALVFFWYGAQGLLPAMFVDRAAPGDLLAGLFAAAIILLPRRRLTITAFHLFGLADFALAVGTGLYLTLTGDPQMQAIATLPVALIPLIGVPLSGATHIAALHMLFTRPRHVPA